MRVDKGAPVAGVLANTGQSLVFRADRDTVGTSELYSVPITGGPSVKLNPPLETFADVRSFAFSPDSNWVVFSAGSGGSTGEVRLEILRLQRDDYVHVNEIELWVEPES